MEQAATAEVEEEEEDLAAGLGEEATAMEEEADGSDRAEREANRAAKDPEADVEAKGELRHREPRR